MDPQPRQLTVFIPCASIENFSVRRSNRETNEIFGGWAATFHPSFVDALDLLPNWSSADYLPDRKSPGIAYLPPCAEDRLPPTDDENAQTPFRILRGISDRHEIASQIAQILGIPLAPIAPKTLRAFEGLGISFFLLEVLGRQYRYMSNLNTDRFRTAVKAAAARAAIEGDATQTELRLHDAFDRLLESREYFFPSGIHFLDLILTDPTHVGAPFRALIRQLELDSEGAMTPTETLPPIAPSSQVSPVDPTTILDTELESESPTDVDPASTDPANPVGESDGALPPKYQKVPVNLWITGQTLERVDAQTLERIRTLMDRGELGIVGGTYSQLRTSLLTPEDLRDQFLEGLSVYRERLAEVPSTFGGRRFALTATLPAILKNFQIDNAFHFALDEGILPEMKQSRIRWRGIGSGSVESLCRVPYSASDSKAWMRTPEQIGSPYGVDGTPTLVVARWPGQDGWVLEVFRTIHRYAPIFGEFRTVSNYFMKTFSSGKLCEMVASEYRSPYVVQSVASGEVDPVTRWVRHYRRRFYADTIRSLMTLYTTIFPKRCDLSGLRERLAKGAISEDVSVSSDFPTVDRSSESQEPDVSPERTVATIWGIDFNEKNDFASFFPSFSRETETGDGDFGGDQKLRETLQELAKRFAHQLVRRRKIRSSGGTEKTEGTGTETRIDAEMEPTTIGTLRLNPWAVPVRWRDQIVEPLGFRWLPDPLEDPSGNGVSGDEDSSGGTSGVSSGSSSGASNGVSSGSSSGVSNGDSSGDSNGVSSGGTVAMEFDEAERLWTLRNDFVHVLVDAVTGEIRSLRSGLRRNRLGLKLAYHSEPDAQSVGGKPNALPGSEAEYSLSAADRIEILTQTSNEVALRICGRLVHRNGTQLAGFRWTLRLTRTSPELDCDVELAPTVLPDAAEPQFRNPWLTAYVLQTAWSNATASLSYSAHWARVDAGECPEGEIQSFDAPHFVHIQTQNTQYTLLCDGLPFHRRYGSHRLDTLLIPAGETGRRFRFAVSVDAVPPAVAAIARMAQDESLAQWLSIPCESPAQNDAWWYRIEPENVVLTGWEPIVESPKSLIPPGGVGSTASGVGATASGVGEAILATAESRRTETKGEVETTTNRGSSAAETTAQIVGVKARILETEGRETHAVLTMYRNVKNAIVTRFTGKDPRSLTYEDDEVRVTLDPHQWRQLEIRWE